MSRQSKRILLASEPRCRPTGHCPLEQTCARFCAPIPPALATVVDHRAACQWNALVARWVCPFWLSLLWDAPKAGPRHFKAWDAREK